MKNNYFSIYLIPKTNYISTSSIDFHCNRRDSQIDTVCECYGSFNNDLNVEFLFTDAHIPDRDGKKFYDNYPLDVWSHSPKYECDFFTFYDEYYLGSLDFSNKDSLFKSIESFHKYSYSTISSHRIKASCEFDEELDSLNRLIDRTGDKDDESKLEYVLQGDSKERFHDSLCFLSLPNTDLAFEIHLPREVLLYQEFHQSINIECDNFYDCKNDCSECKYYNQEFYYRPCITSTLGINPMLLKNFNFWQKS
jgi:hypothetical protein